MLECPRRPETTFELGASFHISYNRARDLMKLPLSADRRVRSESDHASAYPELFGL